MIGRLTAPTSAEQRRHPPVAAPLPLGRGQRDIAEVEEEQDQHRGQPPVPFPPGAPGRPAPDRAGGKAERGEGRAGRRDRAAGDGGQRMAPDELADRGGGDRRPARHAEPGGGNMDVEDADRLALQIVGRRHRQPAIDAGDQQAARRCPAASRWRAGRSSGSGRDWRNRAWWLVPRPSGPLPLRFNQLDD